MATDHQYLRKKIKLSEGVQCFAINCYNYRNQHFKKRGITFHRFPNQDKEPGRYEQWVKACRRIDRQPSKWAMLCSAHFTDAAIDRTGQIVRLREGAVPTICSVAAHLKTQTSRSKVAGLPPPEAADTSDTGDDINASSHPDQSRSYFLESPVDAGKLIIDLRQRIDDLQKDLENTAAVEKLRKSYEHKLKEITLLTAELEAKLEAFKDVQQVLVVKEEVPLEWSPSSNLQDPEPLPVKEEEEELCISQEEAESVVFPFTVVMVKSEDEEDELHQSQAEDVRETETDAEDCGGPEPAWNHDPVLNLQSEQKKDSDFCGTETGDEDDEDRQEPLSGGSDGSWTKSRMLQSGINHKSSRESFSCSECCRFLNTTRRSGEQSRLNKTNEFKEKKNADLQTSAGQKGFICEKCDKTFRYPSNLELHLRVHSEKKPFSCDECDKMFRFKASLKSHKRVHSGQTSFRCEVCGKGFKQKSHFRIHTRVHLGEQPFSCDGFDKTFQYESRLNLHIKGPFREKPQSSV
ncbi:zinc finger protein 184 isoform X2 [Kryptolebias marmoratus]|uniref:zinc finger protein 184 isoform X2 n=1 Tax=Kryptolebias marmoratus TaxID=37003 RepID=UPI0007F8D5EB|nr:zinc finger protein 184 isoform X2 [Kryptolebias marmoratus]